MPIDVVIGLQVGDEGKGKAVDELITINKYNIVARYNGGPNAGHTVYDDEGNKHVLHALPVGVLRSGVTNVIGHNCVINLNTLLQEMEMVKKINPKAHILISEDAHIITSFHIEEESINGEADRIGSTKRGITPCYRNKYNRTGLRIIDLLKGRQHIYNILLKQLNLVSCEGEEKESTQKLIEFLSNSRKNLVKTSKHYHEIGIILRPYIINDIEFILKNSSLKILCEGAQGSMLDIDLGIYPFVSSSSSNVGGAITGLGIPPRLVERIYGVCKGYNTKVGTGPHPTLMEPTEENLIRTFGSEFGATTGRPRQVGWLDLPQLKYACMVNGVTDLIITKLDVMAWSGLENVKIGINYKNNLTGETISVHKNNLPYEDIIVYYKYFDIWDFTKKNAFSKKGSKELNTFISFIKHEIESNNKKYFGKKLNLGILVSTGPKRGQIVRWK